MMGSEGAVSDGDESTGLARVDDSRVQAEQVAALYSRTAGGIVGSTGAALAMCAFYFDRVPTSVVGAWGGCMLVVVVARIWLLRGYRVAPDSRPAAAWRLWSRLGSAINGLGWGLFFPLFHVADAMGMHALQLVVGAGIMAGAVSMLTVDALSGYLFVTLLGVPAALTFASDPTPIHLAFVAMMTLFLVFMWEFIHTNSATYLRMLRLRFGNRDLVGELRAANADTNRLNRDLVAARDEALAAARAKGEFLAVMSHEIRTPINGMLGMSELLLETRLGERQRRFAETVLHSGQTLLALVNDVLDFARIDEGRLELDDSVFSLRELAEDICALFAVPAERRGLELTCAVAADAAGAYRGDCGRLRQVLTNLLSNAIKFTSSGEVGLRVEAEPDGDRVRLCFEVHDTGVGIAPDERDRIFEPFEQASAGTAREYGGTGLGLAISRHLVELMGGTLEVESERARGSSFRFSIALPPAADAGAESGGQPPALHGVRILIVDDNPTNREVLAGALESWGVRCIAAASGDEALARLRQCAANGDAVEVALIDQHMPGMNGTQLVGAIRAENRLDGLRVVLLNSVSDPEHSGEWRIRGIDAHMAKPVRNHELLATLRALCAAPRVEAAVDAAAPADAGKAGSAGRVRGGVMALLAPSISGSGPRVLLAEDNEVNQEVAREMLLSLGCSVDIAVDGREAVRAIARRRYALVLMDCQMPVQDGYAAASEVRSRERAAGHRGRTPIVALTANTLSGERARCLAAGMDDYLSKPVTRAQLADLLRRWVGSGAAGASRGAPIQSPERADEPPSIAVAGATEVLDGRALDEIRALDEADGAGGVFARVISLFLERAPQLVDAVHQAVAGGDAEGLRTSAHTLKSSSANVGAAALAAVSLALENIGRGGDLDAAPPVLASLDDAYHQARAALAELCGERAA